MTLPSWIGQTLGGRYRIDELLGQGGMSSVYKAYDANLKRTVAVKIVHPHLASDPAFRDRFESEATAVAQLRHPNIVQVFDFNHDGDVYYMVQEFLPGETLQDRLRRLNKTGRRMPIPEAQRFTIDISEAAGYAHRRGMIHRDIKPANIMLDVQGSAILMDFGIVKIAGAQRHTATGAVLGTALYLPPELIRGEAPDPRSDLYSLGVTLFEMVSGHPPFEADSAMTLLMMHLNDPVPDLRTLRPEVPEGLIAIIERSLQKDRDRRYASMADLAAALKALQAPPLSWSASAASSPAAETRVEPRQEIRPTAPAGRVKPSAQPDVAGSVEDEDSKNSTHPKAAPASIEAAASGQGAAAAFGDAPAPADAPAAPTSRPPRPSPPAISPFTEGAAASEGAGAAVFPADQPGELPDRRQLPRPLLWVGGLAGLLALALLVFLAGMYLFRRKDQPLASVLASSTAPSRAVLAGTQTPVEGYQPTASPASAGSPTAASGTFPPLAALSSPPAPSPSPTNPIGVPFVRIRSITIGPQKGYLVDYAALNFSESLDGFKVHFFFDNVPPEKAGGAAGPFYAYAGPHPFNGYVPGDRPQNAARLCALVATPDHSVIQGSGNCLILPDIVAAAPWSDTSCLSGPGPAYPPVAAFKAGQVAPVLGISPDEAWWEVALPYDANGSCWLQRLTSDVSGNTTAVPQVQPPPTPTGAAAAAGTPGTESALSVRIQKISIDSQGHYVVEYTTQGYTEHFPGNHVHFFFNTVPPEKAGAPNEGLFRMYAGPRPFTGYTTSDRPADAFQMCALVATTDHTPLLGTGNCVTLPDAP